MTKAPIGKKRKPAAKAKLAVVPDAPPPVLKPKWRRQLPSLLLFVFVVLLAIAMWFQ